MKTRIRKYLIFVIILIFSSCSTEIKNKTESVINIDTLENNRIVRTEIVTTYNESSDTILKILTRIENVDNDYKTLLLTGKKSDDGLSDWLIDSFFYNVDVFDTIQLNYKSVNNDWIKNQTFKKQYDKSNNLIYFQTERFDRPGFKIEEFLQYNSDNQIISKTRHECEVTVSCCDSIYKDVYYYNSVGKLDSTEMLVWKNKEWTKFKKEIKAGNNVYTK